MTASLIRCPAFSIHEFRPLVCSSHKSLLHFQPQYSTQCSIRYSPTRIINQESGFSYRQLLIRNPLTSDLLLLCIHSLCSGYSSFQGQPNSTIHALTCFVSASYHAQNSRLHAPVIFLFTPACLIHISDSHTSFPIYIFCLSQLPYKLASLQVLYIGGISSQHYSRQHSFQADKPMKWSSQAYRSSAPFKLV